MNNEISKQQTLEFWVERHSDQLYSWAFHKTHSKETAEDLVQETFFSAIKSYEKCKNKNQPKSWLFAILNNKIIDFYRKSAKSWNSITSNESEKPTQIINNLFDQFGNWTAASQKLFAEERPLLDIPEFNSLLEKCLDDLPKNWKFAILSKYIYNKKGTEISQELGITPSNYWQVIHRAKVFLKICLEKYWKE